MQLFLSTFFLLLFSFFFFNSSAQFPCGTLADKKQISELQKFHHEYEMKKSHSDETYYVPIKIHIIRNTNGTGGLSEQKFYKELDSVNYFYKNAKIQFNLCGKINYINDSQFGTFSAPDEEDNLVKPTEFPRVINIYFMDTLLLNGNHICGFSYLPVGPNTIFIDNSCVNNGNTLAHELGHFFSLLHTHGKSNTTLTDELVNESNCSVAGDLICDTPADPNLTGKVTYNLLTKKCTYTGNAKDVNGEFFKPMVENIMSYSKPQCTDSFTLEQYEKIRNSLFYHGRIDLICTSENDVIDESKIRAVFPNPFQNYFFVNYQLSADSRVTLALYNLLGEKIFEMYDQTEAKGFLKLYYPLGDSFLNSGIYFLKMEVNEKPVSVKKIMRIND